ncbi:MAG: hypothetical protein MZV70_66600 [Desulfobacterales bacterium]|nr:hypothetical protein [Desulfobacterales bacterium]
MLVGDPRPSGRVSPGDRRTFSLTIADLARGSPLGPAPPDLALPGLRPGLRHQGAALPAPHLAPRRPRRGPHGRLGHPGRRAPQDGRLRLPALRHPALPRGRGLRSPRPCPSWPSSASSTAALMALVQKDMKSPGGLLVSVSHLGLVMLAVFAAQRRGRCRAPSIQMLNHGLSTGALFLCVGILYERTPHPAHRATTAALRPAMPVFAGLFLVAMLSSAGLPGPQRLRRRDPVLLRHLRAPNRPWPRWASRRSSWRPPTSSGSIGGSCTARSRTRTSRPPGPRPARARRPRPHRRPHRLHGPFPGRLS